VQGIEHKIDSISGASLPNRAAYRTNRDETKEIQRQVQDLLDRRYILRALVLVLFLFFWFLRKMALGACVLIVEPSITLPFDIAILFLVWMT
jgi:multidrug efflux pump subunit AcrB